MPDVPRPLIDPEGDLSRTSGPAVLTLAEYWAAWSGRAPDGPERRAAVRASERAFLEAERRGIPDALVGRAKLLASLGRVEEAEQLAEAIVQRGGAPVHHLLARRVADPGAVERLNGRAAELGVFEVLAERADVLIDQIEAGDGDPQLVLALDENLRRQNESLRAGRSRTAPTEVFTRVGDAVDLIDRSVRASGVVAAVDDPQRAATYLGDAVITATGDAALAPALHTEYRDVVDDAYAEWVDRLDEVGGEESRREVVERTVAEGNAQLGLLDLRLGRDPRTATFARTKAGFERAIRAGVPTAAAQWVTMLAPLVISEDVWIMNEDGEVAARPASLEELVARMDTTTTGSEPVDPQVVANEFRRLAPAEMVRVAMEQADREPELLLTAAGAFRRDPITSEMLIREAVARDVRGSVDILFAARQERVQALVGGMSLDHAVGLADRMADSASNDAGEVAEVLRATGQRLVDAGEADRGRVYLARAADRYVDATLAGDMAAIRSLSPLVMNAWDHSNRPGCLAGGRVEELLEGAAEIVRSAPTTARTFTDLARNVAFVAEARPEAFGEGGLSEEAAAALASTCEQVEGTAAAVAFVTRPNVASAIDYARSLAAGSDPSAVERAVREVGAWIDDPGVELNAYDRTDLAEALHPVSPQLSDRVLVEGSDEHRESVVFDWLSSGTVMPLPKPPEQWAQPGEPDGLDDDGLGGMFAEPFDPGPVDGLGGMLHEPPPLTAVDLGLGFDADFDADGGAGAEMGSRRNSALSGRFEVDPDPEVDPFELDVTERRQVAEIDDSVSGPDVDTFDISGF